MSLMGVFLQRFGAGLVVGFGCVSLVGDFDCETLIVVFDVNLLRFLLCDSCGFYCGFLTVFSGELLTVFVLVFLCDCCRGFLVSCGFCCGVQWGSCDFC